MIDQFVHSAMEVFRNTTGELRAVEQEERHHGRVQKRSLSPQQWTRVVCEYYEPTRLLEKNRWHFKTLACA